MVKNNGLFKNQVFKIEKWRHYCKSIYFNLFKKAEKKNSKRTKQQTALQKKRHTKTIEDIKNK